MHKEKQNIKLVDVTCCHCGCLVRVMIFPFEFETLEDIPCVFCGKNLLFTREIRETLKRARS